MPHTVLFQRNVFLISMAVWMCLTESLWENPVCDENSVYHYGSKSCLRLFYRGSSNLKSRCSQYKAGVNESVSGKLARIDFGLEGFLRDYLWHLTVPRAAVNVYYAEHCNKDLFHRINYQKDGPTYCRHTRLVMSLAKAFGVTVSWELLCADYDVPAFCQVEAADIATEESGCPSNVTLESVSESNATFYLTPGKTKTQVRFSVYQPCNNMTSSLCRNPTTKLNEKIFLVKPTTQSVLALEPSTRYWVQFRIDGYPGRTFVCNETVDFTTNEVAKSQHAEESRFKSEVIGLSVILACSLCGIVVLAILYCRLRQLIGQDNTGLAPARVMPTLGKGKGLKEVAQANMKAKTPGNAHSSSSVGISQTPSNARNANKPASKGSNSEFGAYTNVQVMSLNYDATDNKLDDHVYEMT